MNENWRAIFMALAIIFAFGCKNKEQGFDNGQNDRSFFTEGTYLLKSENPLRSELEIMFDENGRINYRLAVIDTSSHTITERLEGFIDILDGKAIIEINEVGEMCLFKIRPLDSLNIQILMLEEDSKTCQYDEAKIPVGIYHRKNEKVQDLSSIEPAQLFGVWRSVKDPTFEIKIDEEDYTEYYRGQKVNSMKYKIEADYLQNGNSPCFTTWDDADTFCFSIIHADSMKLELSMKGGANKSLQLERLK